MQAQPGNKRIFGGENSPKCLFSFNDYKTPYFCQCFSLRRENESTGGVCECPSLLPVTFLTPLCNFYAPLFLLCHHLVLWGKVLILFSFNLFLQLLVEFTAHSRSSAMPVSCVNMNLSRIRMVGSGPGVESGESILVYLWMPQAVPAWVSEPQFTHNENMPENRCPNYLTELLRGSNEQTGAKQHLRRWKKLHTVVFWNQKVTKAHHGSSLGEGQTRGLDSSLPS